MSAPAMTPGRNTLYYGDNLPILREHLADESVDLIYLDPPGNVTFRQAERVGGWEGETQGRLPEMT